MKLSNRFVVVMLLAIVLVGGATWALADVGNTIYACVTPGGTIRVVSGPTECGPQETELSWNIVGPTGPSGPPGPPAGPGTYYTVELYAQPPVRHLHVVCDTGDQPTGGGHEISDLDVLVLDSLPTHIGWFVEIYPPPAYEWRAKVVCADFPPLRP